MPETTEGILVSAASVGTLTALAAAAHARVDDRDQATAYVQEHTHAAIAKAWRILGFNPANLRVLQGRPRPPPAARGDRRRDPRSTARRASSRSPSSAPRARTSTGSVDPLNDLADLAAARGPVVPRRRRLRRARAPDARAARTCWPASSAPTASCSTRTSGSSSPTRSARCWSATRTALKHAFTLDGAYLRDTKTDFVEFRECGPQLTRGARALKLYLSLRTFGLDAFKEAIATLHRAGRARRAAARRATRSGRSSRPRRWR